MIHGLGMLAWIWCSLLYIRCQFHNRKKSVALFFQFNSTARFGCFNVIAERKMMIKESRLKVFCWILISNHHWHNPNLSRCCITMHVPWFLHFCLYLLLQEYAKRSLLFICNPSIIHFLPLKILVHNQIPNKRRRGSCLYSIGVLHRFR